MSKGRFFISDELMEGGFLDTAESLGFNVIRTAAAIMYGVTMVYAKSDHFKDGPGTYDIIMQKDEGKDPYVLRAELIEEA